MAKETKEEKKGMLGKAKELFSPQGDWKIPAAAGIVTAILFGGPFGLGVAVGIYAAANIKGGASGPVSGTKTVALKTIGGITSGACTVIGAGIGSVFLPVVGTIIGAGVGCVFGMFASKKVTATIRDKYIDKAEAKVEEVVHDTEKAVGLKEGKSKGHGKTKTPDATPRKKESKNQNHKR